MIVKPFRGIVSRFDVAPEWQRLWDGLLWATVFNDGRGYEILSGAAPTFIGTQIKIAGGEHGLCLDSTGSLVSVGAYWPATDVFANNLTDKVTVVVFADPDAVENYSMLWCLSYGATWTSPYTSLSFGRQTTTTSMRFAIAINTGTPAGYAVNSDTGLLQTSDGPTLYGVTRNGATNRFYRNGMQFGSDVNGTAENIYFETTQRPPVMFNRHTVSSDYDMYGKAWMAAVWGRDLDAGEMAMLGANPTGPFTPYRHLVQEIIYEQVVRR